MSSQYLFTCLTLNRKELKLRSLGNEYMREVLPKKE